MKLLWLAHESGWSGANMCLYEYLEVLKKENTDIYVILPKQGEFSRKLQEKKIKIIYIKFYPWSAIVNKRPTYLYRMKRWLRNGYAINQITSVIKELNPDFVITNTIVTPVAAKAASKTKKKHIWFIHEFGEEDHGFTIAGSFKRGAMLINKLSHKVVFNSAATQKKYGNYIEESKSCIIQYVINAGKRTAPYKEIEGKFKLIMLGQLAPSKNQLDAINALAICSKQGLDFECNITGNEVDKEYTEIIKSTIAKLGLSDKIFLTGPVLQPDLFLQQHHVLLMCSRMEAFGRVTAEALKMGLPAIAADSGGSPEIIEEGINGYLYHSGDVNDLASKIIQLKEKYGEFDKEAIECKAREKYNASNTLRQLKQLFATV